jgi:hypothetical protein
MSAGRNPFGIRTGTLVRAVGTPLAVTPEIAQDRSRIDHLWITLDVGIPLQVSINTLSKRNRDAGFDPRVRMARVGCPPEPVPPRSIRPAEGLDYAGIESRHNAFYETYGREELERELIARIAPAPAIEVWGEFYCRESPGIHQVHSRRASCAVAADLAGRDGGLKIHGPDGSAPELLLFKFCGQP